MSLIEVSLLGLATAAMEGAISFLSPCWLPLVPGYPMFFAAVLSRLDILERLPKLGIMPAIWKLL
jgi:cytochrome c biogenesis protein CcdA